MCDTLYKKTNDGYIFGKNSDRSPNEPNLSLFYPALNPKTKDLNCTYISLPQVEKTNELLLVQPSWMWGGEMGINEYGVVIGNEAVFTKNRKKKLKSLIGMDLLRLALERAKTAFDAKEIIKELLFKHSQGGNCGFDKKFYYDNSFLINDEKTAFVLETVGQEWAEREINKYYNISNRLSLNCDYNTNSKYKKKFAEKQSDILFTHFSGSKTRENTGRSFLEQADFSISDMIAALRYHEIADTKRLYSKGSIKSICMHGSVLGDHTTNSMIVVKKGFYTTIWLTGASTPCLSIYKPLYFSQVVAPVYKNKEESFDYWLQREYLVRAIYAGIIDGENYQEQLKSLEQSFIKEEDALLKTNPSNKELEEFSIRCSNKEQSLILSYQDEIETIKTSNHQLPRLWKKYTKKLGIDVYRIYNS